MAKFILSAFADEASPDIDEQVSALKKNRIEMIEPRNVNGKNISDFTVDEAKALKEKLDAAGIKVSSIGSAYGKIFINEEFEPHFEAFKNTVEVAKILGTKYIRMFSFYFLNGESREEYRDEVFARMSTMVDFANENGILCCHENERGIYGDTPERCIEIAEYFGERIGNIFDPANYILNGNPTKAGFDALKDKIT